jgi:hypothetical protein
MNLIFGAAKLPARVSLWHTPGKPVPGQKWSITGVRFQVGIANAWAPHWLSFMISLFRATPLTDVDQSALAAARFFPHP